MTRRVVITGLGVVSALGMDLTTYWQTIRAGQSGIGPVEDVDMEGISFANGAQIRGFEPGDHLDKREDRVLLDRNAQFALLAARQAVADAGLDFDDATAARTAVTTGCSCGGMHSEAVAYHDLYAKNRRKAHPMSIPKLMANSAASRISMEWGLRGPVYNISTACSSANHAMGMAFHNLRHGLADVAVTGGNEALFTLGNLRAWDALRVVAPDTCRPFSAGRLGMVLGEGSGMLVLETEEHALARGARIYAEVSGFGLSADAHHLTMASLEGPASAMRSALADAGLQPTDVDYINAHGTGTLANDPNEAKAIHEVFGEHTAKLAVSSTKSMHGHAIGAAGALEAVATTLGIHHGVLPPTANFQGADPECDLDVVPNESRPRQIRAALSNSFAFGGLNAVLAFRSHQT